MVLVLGDQALYGVPTSPRLCATHTEPAHTVSPASANPTPAISALLEAFAASHTANLSVLTNVLHAPHLGQGRPAPARPLHGDAW